MPAPQPSLARSTVSGVESSDLDDDDLQFGKNRRTRMVRWLMLGLVVATVLVIWMVISSQLRGGDPGAATAPPPPVPTPTVMPAFDPIPAATPTTTTSTAPAPSVKLTGRLRPANPPGTGATPRPKKPGDGSVELPTPGDDPGLPPPAP